MILEKWKGMDGSSPCPDLVLQTMSDTENTALYHGIMAFIEFAREFGSNVKHGDYSHDDESNCWHKRMCWKTTRRIHLKKAQQQLSDLKPTQVYIHYEGDGMRET